MVIVVVRSSGSVLPPYRPAESVEMQGDRVAQLVMAGGADEHALDSVAVGMGGN